jgi:hypothetical protein
MLTIIGAQNGMEQASGWSVLLHASTFILNDQEWLSVPGSFEPRFHPCVLVQGLAPDDLFSRCMKVLRPLMNAAASDVYAADGNCSIEGMFDENNENLDESKYFDSISYLAVLASPVLGSLHRSSGHAVELLGTEQAGLSATVTSHVLTGRDREACEVDKCICPVFTLDDSSYHCKLVLIHGIPGTGKSSLADSAISRMETAYKASDSISGTGENVEEYSYKIQARKGDFVRDGLHKLGLSVCGKRGFSCQMRLSKLRFILIVLRSVLPDRNLSAVSKT